MGGQLRKLTPSEISLLLQPIFLGTLPYKALWIGTNDLEFGGLDNSITFSGRPLMAQSIWAPDYSAAPAAYQWVFIHEFAHVFNWCHGGSNIRSGLWLGAGALFTSKSYEDYYPYDLSQFNSLDDYNFEQRASIIADYWYVLMGKAPKHNTSSSNTLTRYRHFIAQVQNAGAPRRSPRDPRTPDPFLIRPPA